MQYGDKYGKHLPEECILKVLENEFN